MCKSRAIRLFVLAITLVAAIMWLAMIMYIVPAVGATVGFLLFSVVNYCTCHMSSMEKQSHLALVPKTEDVKEEKILAFA